MDHLPSQASCGGQCNPHTCNDDMRDTYPFRLCIFDHITNIVLFFNPDNKFTYNFEEHNLEMKYTVWENIFLQITQYYNFDFEYICNYCRDGINKKKRKTCTKTS